MLLAGRLAPWLENKTRPDNIATTHQTATYSTPLVRKIYRGYLLRQSLWRGSWHGGDRVQVLGTVVQCKPNIRSCRNCDKALHTWCSLHHFNPDIVFNYMNFKCFLCVICVAYRLHFLFRQPLSPSSSLRWERPQPQEATSHDHDDR